MRGGSSTESQGENCTNTFQNIPTELKEGAKEIRLSPGGHEDYIENTRLLVYQQVGQELPRGKDTRNGGAS